MGAAASYWPSRIKQALGRLELPMEFEAARKQQLFEELSVGVAHTDELPRIPALHQDPFDRILLAQARVEGLLLLSADSKLHAYGDPVLPA